jgi:ankyrin repeat protein
LHVAIRVRDSAWLAAHIRAGEPVNTVDHAGYTPLQLAAEKGFDEAVGMLLACVHVEVDLAREHDNATALMLAAERGWYGIVDQLLSVKADVHVKRGDGATALFIAALSGVVGPVSALLSAGASVNEPCDDGETPVFNMGSDEVVQLLIDNGARVDYVNHAGFTPLHKAAQVGIHTRVWANMLKLPDANVNAVTVFGATPLYLAAQYRHTSMAEMLLEKAGVEINTRLTCVSPGASALYAAAETGNNELVALLLQAGADVNAAVRTTGATPLLIAVRGSLITVHRNFVTIIATLLQSPSIDVNARWHFSGKTALRGATRGAFRDEIVNMLIDKGATI